ncbi:MAG: 1,4-alpha-glucan branching protein domain-containing protein [Phycisphaeraceae bacterium]|nr:1,4-alpha-glucan branching protein domain-containing protein [Phycisphaeraceae bacterium]
MSEPAGDFCLVLHGHLPYVLHHGTWPHGEDWLYEAAAETYLPILEVIEQIHEQGAWPGITLGLTPVLLEQLGHDRFKAGLVDYFDEHIERAKRDAADFRKSDDPAGPHLAYLAERWEAFYTQQRDQFEAIDRDLPGAFAQWAEKGSIEILTSNATHGYMPLLSDDSSLRAQMRAGVATSEKHLGFKPTGMWLPECAYRPRGPWTPPVPWAGREDRPGVEHFIAEAGVDHFFVEHHLLENSRSEGVTDDGGREVGWDAGKQDPGRGWYSVNEPVWAYSSGGLPPEEEKVAAMARDPEICERVWSGRIGYPADGTYLEFHRKHGGRRGLRYWKITAPKTDLGDKQPYVPDDIQSKVHEHAQHFCDSVRRRLAAHRERTGRRGVVVASFDAELFGHWWFEGPAFLRDVLLTLHHDESVAVKTSAGRLEEHPPDKVASLPEGSWGDGGDHRVWANEQTGWMWEQIYRAEATFGRLTCELEWEKDDKVRELLELAGRELLLLQASDWPFVIRRGQAVDYGIKRFALHGDRFEKLADAAERMAAGEKLTELDQLHIEEATAHDPVFEHLDLAWWGE